MSSWLDTKKFVTSLAKTAMAEAQKTLDKALDIEEEEQLRQQQQQLEAVNEVSEVQRRQANGDGHSVITSVDFNQWGSFTGSFFSTQDMKSAKKSQIIIGT
jgi:hypothetical protein